MARIAFAKRMSGRPLESRVDSPAEAAGLVRAHRGLKLPGAVVVAQSVPEAEALDREAMEAGLAEGLALANERGVVGKAVTPFLLAHFHAATQGRSLAVNVRLILRNAELAAQIAARMVG